MTANAYTARELLAMEVQILNTLEYETTPPTAYRFLEVVSKLQNFTGADFLTAHFILELSMMEYNMLSYTPAVLATASVYIAAKMRVAKFSYENIPCTQDELKTCARDLCFLISASKNWTMQSIRNKFSLA